MSSINQRFPKLNLIFIAVSFFVFLKLIIGSATASEESQIKRCLPVLDIIIDGQEHDWAGTKPQLEDLPGDSNIFTHTGIDILSCTVATNQRRDTLFVMVKVMGGPNFEYNLVQYMMGLDDPTIKSTSRIDFEWLNAEWLVGIDSFNKLWIWDLRGKNGAIDQSKLKTWASSKNKLSKYAQDDVIEYSMPFSIFQGMEEFKLQLFLKLRDRDKTRTDQVHSETFFIHKACIEK